MTDPDHLERRRQVVIAGHSGDVALVRSGLDDTDAGVREAALGAMARLGNFDIDTARRFAVDPEPRVRRRVAELSAALSDFDLSPLLSDGDSSVVETAAWACGEQVEIADATLRRIIELATDHDDVLVREAAVAALGAIGDERGLPAILHGCSDKPAIRRRAVLALAPFDGPDVDAALRSALDDRDWQVRQAAEDLLG
ncbi:MAG: HEAT repeat domain-containing protein [Ilumatobacteraceae bacterium]